MRILFKHNLPILTVLSLFGIWATAQVQYEVEPPSHIKSIIFKGPTEDQFPIIRLGETISLQFDDLTANESDYYYKIIHCDYDWTPSDLLKSQFLDGVDNQRIIDYGNSYNTLQPYSNYRLSIPNNEVSLLVTGNYVLEIHDSYGDLVFSRRFLVYKDVVGIGVQIRRTRDFDFLEQKQVVQFTVNPGTFQIINPKKELKIAILQNYNWNQMVTDVVPQFARGNQLIYRYDKETSFFGGNEFLNFDTKDLRAPSVAISHISLDDIYHHHLFPNRIRTTTQYTYFPDINGDFAIRTLQGEDNAREAEYTMVHFKLPYEPELGFNKVYVYGKFNNYDLTEENQMELTEEGYYELAFPFKQGFYNFKYVVEREDGTLGLNDICGNFHFTENNYLVLAYYRDFGELYDGLIGIGFGNSRDISN